MDVRASDKGQEIIETKREEKQWSKREDSEALIITSQNVFREKLTELIPQQENGTINILTIQDLMSFVRNNNFFAINKSTQEVQNIIIELQNKNNQTIGVDEFVNLIRLREIHMKGITSVNWRNFLRKEKIPRNVFIAFCEALEIHDWSDVTDRAYFERKYDTKPTHLASYVSQFNHNTQIDLLQENYNNQIRAFIISNSCEWSRIWMLKCLVNNISFNPSMSFEYKFFPSTNIDSKYSSMTVSELEKKIEKEYGGNKKLIKALNKNHIFFVINIDNYDLERLEKLIENFWQPLLYKINQTTPGKLLMFLLASGKNNNWQNGKWRDSPILTDKVFELDPANPFSEEHVRDLSRVLRKITFGLPGKFTLRPGETPDGVASNLINESGGDSYTLLCNIYEYFKCERDRNFVKTWQQYP